VICSITRFRKRLPTCSRWCNVYLCVICILKLMPKNSTTAIELQPHWLVMCTRFSGGLTKRVHSCSQKLSRWLWNEEPGWSRVCTTWDRRDSLIKHSASTVPAGFIHTTTTEAWERAVLPWMCLLILLTRLKQGWINSGIIKMLCMILKHSCKEPEVVASVYMKNLSMYLNRKVIKWGGHRGLGLRS